MNSETKQATTQSSESHKLRTGDWITWRTANGIESGMIQGTLNGYNLLVKLKNGKDVVVSCYCIVEKLKKNGKKVQQVSQQEG